jgi:hypothetical protein
MGIRSKQYTLNTTFFCLDNGVHFIPRKYIQYRTYLRDRNNSWVMSVQPAGRREILITHWRYLVDEAIRTLKSKEKLYL